MNDRPWLKNYPNGVPVNIDVEKYQTLIEFFDEIFEKYKSKPAFYNMGKTLTFDQVNKYSMQFATYLQSRGLESGDRVALMMPNLLQYPIALLGCVRAGLVVVNTNPLYTPPEMEHQFVDSGVKAIIMAENFAANLQKILPKTQIKTIILTSIGEMLGTFKGSITNFVVRKVKRMVPEYDLPNVVQFSDALTAGKKFTLKEFDNSPDKVVVHQYTGGTTGVAKGAMLTNRNLISNMLQIKAFMSTVLKDGEEVILCPLPLYHIFAFTVNCMAMMAYGAVNVLVTNPRDLPSLMKEFKNHKITLMTGVNTLFNALLHNQDFAKMDFSSLKVVVGGGTAVQDAVATKWKEVTGCTLSEGYGLTEAAPVVTINPLDGTGKMGSIGLPLPSTDVRVIDDNGSVLGINQAGEIQVKGPQVMKGYYNKPSETSKMINDGWLSTGDIGMMDEEGYFRIVDRKKDIVIVSGFNVYPNEIEDVISKHPKVMECAAIGIPDEKSGEVVKVFVVRKDKSLKEKELIEFCRESLTGYKVPKVVEFRRELPKSNVGKILRKVLRAEEVENKAEQGG